MSGVSQPGSDFPEAANEPDNAPPSPEMRKKFPHPFSRVALVALMSAFLLCSFLFAQNEALDEAKDKAGSILSDPRLRNMLRPIKEDPGAALENLKQDPDDMVREATRLFNENKGSIDTEKVTATVKEVAAKAEKEGLVDKARSSLSDVMDKPVPVDVPATRPAPGISGGAPTPVAMPIEANAAADTEPGAPAPGNTATAPDAVIGNSSVESIAGAAPTTPRIPDSPGLTPDEIPAPQPLTKTRTAGKGKAFPTAGKKTMEILSKKCVMDDGKDILLFTGDVFIDHPEFEIKCDKLEITMADGSGMEGEKKSESSSNFKRAIASGGMVEITRYAYDDKGKPTTQIALARVADYDAIKGEFVLSGGPPYIQDGDKFIKTNSEDAQIIMRKNGLYEILGSTNRSTIVIPIEQDEKKPGKKKGGPSDFGGGLGDAFNGLR
jgi:lipopolysaccharide export system protein LptA